MKKTLKSLIPFTPKDVLNAYCHGFFPMGEKGSYEISWFRPNPRAIFNLNDFHIPTSLKKILRKAEYTVKINTAFHKVITLCANNRKDGTWITKDFINLYYEIHKLGFAHSLEIYEDNCLLGGLYGISINGAFFGESMFSLKSNFSKIALCELVFRMKAKKMTLLDTQFSNNHLKQFNISLISDASYYKLLEKALSLKVKFISSDETINRHQDID